MTQRDHFEVTGVHARYLDSSLVCLSAAVREEALGDLSRSDLSDFLGKCDDGFVGEESRSVLQLVDLRFHLRGNPRVGMTNRDGHDAAEEVEILVAIGIPEILHAGVICDERLREVRCDRWEKILLMFANDFFFSHINLSD